MSAKSDENIDPLDAFHSQVTICMLTPWAGPPPLPFFFYPLDLQSAIQDQTTRCPRWPDLHLLGDGAHRRSPSCLHPWVSKSMGTRHQRTTQCGVFADASGAFCPLEDQIVNKMWRLFTNKNLKSDAELEKRHMLCCFCMEKLICWENKAKRIWIFLSCVKRKKGIIN